MQGVPALREHTRRWGWGGGGDWAGGTSHTCGLGCTPLFWARSRGRGWGKGSEWYTFQPRFFTLDLDLRSEGLCADLLLMLWPQSRAGRGWRGEPRLLKLEEEQRGISYWGHWTKAV